MNCIHNPKWSATAVLSLFLSLLSAQPPCDAVDSQISADDLPFAAESGSDQTNLTLGYQTGPVVSFPLSGQVDGADLQTTKVFKSDGGSPEACLVADRSGASHNTRYDVYRLIPNRSATVTFSKDPGSQNTLLFTVFKDSFDPTADCGPNWLAASFNQATGINRLEVTVDLELGTTYYVMVAPTASGMPSYPFSYSLDIEASVGADPVMYTGEDFAANYDYIYIAADTANGNAITAISPTGDFRSLPTGNYEIHGVNYDTLLVQEESFITETPTSIQDNGGTPACLQLSGNVLALTVVDAAAPVDWLTFRGEGKATSVELFWDVAAETENDYFRIERSPDGKSWKDIGEVAGNGTTQAYAAFTFTDADPLPGNAFYRLVQVDFDGTEHLSTVVEVTWRKTTGSIATFPNPFGDQLTVEGVGAVTDTPRIFDLQGREVSHLVELRERSDERIVLATAALPRGMYLLRWGGVELRIVKN
ncbi:T9SS type A sorting domain-containing protein [Lewinella sp. JB7]|uniref:T9SS type A sorting domain-containing protein n=1 Tax=Lewinella sp. JB7 TaxID=2962887 RepID=UPI0020C960EF|nr:T9SS type A sorting domain-containing protein [Lewinella sp. JB7]MCP9234890.1 T9SS type A sorting domain-containing protein [Lewinella sp. JB7]